MPEPVRLTLIFAAAFIGISIAFVLVDMFFGFRTSVNGFIAAVSAALICGQLFASRQGRAPTNSEANRYTAYFVLALVLVTAVQMAVLPGAATLLAETAFLWLVLAFLLVSILGVRFFFAFGARQSLKARRRGD